jgi:hypothetical protein
MDKYKLPAPTYTRVAQESISGTPLIDKAVDVVTWDIQSQIALLRLHNFSQYPVDNAFFYMQNAHETGGIFSMSTVCLLHAVSGGIFIYITSTFFKRVGPTACSDIDEMLHRMVKTKRQAEMDNFPRTDFTHGVTNLSNLKSCEHDGIVFLLAVLCRSGGGKERLTLPLQQAREHIYEAKNPEFADKHLDDTEHPAVDNFGQLFEMLMCFHAWTKKDGGFWDCTLDEESIVACESIATDAIATMLDKVKGYCPRVKLTKSKEVETEEEYDADTPAALVQKRHSTFVKQASNMRHRQTVLDVALKKMRIGDSSFNAPVNALKRVSEGTRYELTYSNVDGHADRWNHVSQVWRTKSESILELKPAVIRFLCEHVHLSKGLRQSFENERMTHGILPMERHLCGKAGQITQKVGSHPKNMSARIAQTTFTYVTGLTK